MHGVRIRIYVKPIRQTATDSAGRYVLDSIPWGNHRVVADGFGLIREERQVVTSCTPRLTDENGALLRAGRCSADHQRLMFSMRFESRHGR
jgi:hypothetical protein